MFPQQVPFEIVDAVLEQTCRIQRRVRDLPARVVVYLLLAGCLCAELGYSQVWHRLAAGLDGLDVAAPTASAMTQARRRLGAGPLRELFFLLRGPARRSAVAGLLVCAIDGTITSVADSAANLAVYSTQRGGRNGDSGYSMLSGSLRAGMLLLADRNFAAVFLAAQIAGAKADFLIRVRTGTSAPKLPVLRRLPDGSWLSRFGGVPVRVIDAEITIETSAGRSPDGCPAHHHPARRGPLPRWRPGGLVSRKVGDRHRHPRRPLAAHGER